MLGQDEQVDRKFVDHMLANRIFRGQGKDRPIRGLEQFQDRIQDLQFLLFNAKMIREEYIYAAMRHKKEPRMTDQSSLGSVKSMRTDYDVDVAS